MPNLIYLTDKPMRVTSATKESLRLAVDVLGVDEIDLLLTVYEGTSVAVKIITGMQTESDIGWVDAGSFTATSANGATKLNITNFLRYVRWEVTSSGDATFMVAGMARTWA